MCTNHDENTAHRSVRCNVLHRNAAYAIIRDVVDDFAWEHATLPHERGFGLRDPTTIVDTARLASLINVEERALEFGAAKEYIDSETSNAISCYCYRAAVFRPKLQPSRELQKMLTQPLHAGFVCPSSSQCPSNSLGHDPFNPSKCLPVPLPCLYPYPSLPLLFATSLPAVVVKKYTQ